MTTASYLSSYGCKTKKKTHDNAIKFVRMYIHPICLRIRVFDDIFFVKFAIIPWWSFYSLDFPQNMSVGPVICKLVSYVSTIFGSIVSKIIAIDPKMMTIDPKIMTNDSKIVMIDPKIMTIVPIMTMIDPNMMMIDPIWCWFFK